LIVVEGLDGAGKRTLSDRLIATLTSRGHSATRVAFPRYGQDVHADLVAEALRGEHGDAADSVYGMALLYALDRRDAAERLRVLASAHDVLLLDRYVASNAAYGAGRLHQGAGGEFVAWVRRLEIDRFGLPEPDGHLLLRVPVAVAAARAERREHAEPGRSRDAFESDGDLQRRCGAVYDDLAAADWLAPWRVVDGQMRLDFDELAEWVHA
jgi:dTMP kinase